MKKPDKFYCLFLGGLLCLTLFGCMPSSDSRESRGVAKLRREAWRQVGMPSIVNFRELRLMKQILEMRDREDLICYAYLWSEYTGKFLYLGRCVGYGLPYSVQYTNPYRITVYGHMIPQPDPNGLFMPEGLDATWIQLIDPQGNPRPVYVEPKLIVTPFPFPDHLVLNPQDNPAKRTP